jgi:hypothetical protein
MAKKGVKDEGSKRVLEGLKSDTDLDVLFYVQRALLAY